MKLIFATIAMAAAVVEAANHQVMVGLTGFTYSPNSVTAAVGDTIEFIVTGVGSLSFPFPHFFSLLFNFMGCASDSIFCIHSFLYQSRSNINRRLMILLKQRLEVLVLI